jgi:hypothetical protein
MLQNEKEKLDKSKQDLVRDKQRLEQQNDDLERRERFVLYSYCSFKIYERQFGATIQDLQERINKLTEDTAWYQTELEEQNLKSKEEVQRMKDEIRGKSATTVH